jgi:hypothetical protein
MVSGRGGTLLAAKTRHRPGLWVLSGYSIIAGAGVGVNGLVGMVGGIGDGSEGGRR